MYKIIGGDGKEYGPVAAGQLRQWIAEGRANAHTGARLEGTSEWKPLAQFSEFSAAFGGPPPPILIPGPISIAPTPRTNSMALMGMVFGILSVTCGMCCYGIPFNILGVIFSLIALAQIRDNPLSQQGKGMAIAGLVLSLLSFVMVALAVAFGLTLHHRGILGRTHWI
jgi:hypothetical protein